MGLSPAAATLNLTLDSMDVETFWQAGAYVDWSTGVTLSEAPPASEGYEKDTHCSAFAAAAALQLGVPLLHPNPGPEFVAEKHLANAQAQWLQALPEDWQAVDGPVEAQDLANQGYFVVISYFNPNILASGAPASGHIQVVRADRHRSQVEVESLGPQVIQAGVVNFNSVTAAGGFASGYASSYPSYPWPDNVRYYAHATDLSES